MGQRGLWFDGRVALERPVEVIPNPPGVVLVDDSGEEHPVDAAQLVRLDSAVGRARFGHRSLEGWRLLLDEPVDPAIGALLPRRRGSLGRGMSPRTMAVLVSATAAVSALAALVIFAPQQLASRMPMSWERKLGAAYDLPIAAARCENPRTRAALDALVDRIDPKARSDGFSLDVASLDMVNAVALPGGRMVLFDGLLNEADNTDAIAGIVAHEIAHVRRRHVAAAMIRELGLGTVIMLVGGGALVTNVGDILSLRFTRTAEAEADVDAIAMLKRAGISPKPTAALFQHFAKDQGKGLSYAEFLQSHPLSRGRAERFAASLDPTVKYHPALTGDQASALLEACS